MSDKGGAAFPRMDSDYRRFRRRALGEEPATVAEQQKSVRDSASLVLRAYRKGQPIPPAHAASCALAAAQIMRVLWKIEQAQEREGVSDEG